MNTQNRARKALTYFTATLGLLMGVPTTAALADDHRGWSNREVVRDGYDRDRRTDVVITRLRAPGKVKRGRSFDVVVEVKNVRSGFAPLTTVDFSAELERRGWSRDRTFDIDTKAYFRNLSPGETQRAKIRVRAPQRTGLYKLTADLDAKGYEDRQNNTSTELLVVVD